MAEATEQEKANSAAREQLQAQLLAVMTDEVSAMAQRYVGVYGTEWRIVVWALHAAQLRALERLHPQIQLAQWEALSGVMEKRLKGLKGEAPPAAPAPEADAEDAADAEG